MDALGLLLRARLRRWRGWVSLCLLAGLLSGLALAAARIRPADALRAE